MTAQEAGVARVLYEPSQRFGDFILVVYAVPHSGNYPPGFEAITEWFVNNPGYKDGRFTIMHLPPFSMLLTVLASKLFQILSPMLVFFVLTIALVVSFFSTLRTKTGAAIAYTAILSYPVAFMIDRGNLYAGLCGACLVAALVRRKTDAVGIMLFAVALNIRPNALPVLLPLLIAHRNIDWRFGLRVGIAAVALGVASAIMAHALYPEYTLSSFRHGMSLYLKGTLDSPLMLAFGSSAYSALYAMGFPSLVLGTVLAGTLASVAIIVRYFGELDAGNFTFICVSAYALGSAVFVDYHMIVFIAPLIMSEDKTTKLASLLLLIPKSYFLINYNPSKIETHYTTTQVLTNPAIMILVSGFILIAGALNYLRKSANGAPASV